MTPPFRPTALATSLVLAFVIAAACATPRTSPLPQPSIADARVLVYNIHAGRDAAGGDNMPAVADLVRSTGADLVLLQEVDQGTRRSGKVDQPAVLAARTGFHVAFGSALDYDGGKYGVAILSRWPILRDTLIHLPVTPVQQRAGGSHEPRGALRVTVASPRGPITVFDTHLDPSGDDHYRRQEADSIASLVAQARRSDALVIAGGDFNSTPESAVQGAVRASGMRDSWTECASGDGFSFPADRPIKRIDYLFVTGEIRCSSARVIDTPSSDHRPVLVDLTIPATSSSADRSVASSPSTTAGALTNSQAGRSIAAAPAGSLDPRVPLTPAQRAWVEGTLESLSLRERIGQMIHVWALGDYANTRDTTYAQLLHWIERDHVGGVTMSLGSPVEVAVKLNALQRAARVPLMVGADLEPNLGRLEGGVFSHYMIDGGSATVFPNAMAIGATGRERDGYDVGRAIGEEAKAVGIRINFAPVVDVNNNPSNPVINTRSFGEDPKRVAALAAAFVRGTQDAGVMSTLKHFPGHGDTDVDSHVGLPMVRGTMARLDSVELVPFGAGIGAGAGMVMTAHIALPAVQGDSTTPATLAPRIITGLLRDSLHFTGLAITDAMTMGGIGKGYSTEESSVLAVQSGADVLLKPSDPARAIEALLAAVERGAISRARIDSSVRRVLELKVRTGLAANRYVALDTLRDVVASPEHLAIAADIARRAMTLLRDRDALVPLTPAGTGRRMVLVQYMPETELRAGRALAATIRSGAPGTRVFKIGPSTPTSTLDSIGAAARGADRVIIATYVRRIEGEGRVVVPPPIAAWIEALAAREKVVVISLGNPYLLRQFPGVGTYLVTYGVADALEHAAGEAVLGRAPITGTIPVSLPGLFQRGDGLRRETRASAGQGAP